MNKKIVQIDKKHTNSQLLRILTKRQVQNQVKAKNSWPGKFNPSFANVRANNPHKSAHKQKQQNKSEKNTMRRKVQSVKLLRNIPIAKMGSVTLSIQPSSRNRTIMMNSTWRTQPNHSNFYSTAKKQNRNIFRITNQGPQNTQIKFGNNRLTTAIEKSRAQSRQFSSSQKDDQLIKNQRQFGELTASISINVNKNNEKKIQNEYIYEEEKRKQKTVDELIYQKYYGRQNLNQNTLDDFIVDFSAFNYIDKVIDNPQKWMKYVRKKNSTAPANINDRKFITKQDQPPLLMENDNNFITQKFE